MATIMLVDDLPANRRLLEALLRDSGHKLIEASDGSAVLDLAKADPPDLVITDVMMPVMDGYKLVEQLRNDPATRHVPVIFYTAHYGARKLALKSGVAWFLTNAESGKLPEIVDRVLAGETEDASSSLPAGENGSSTT